MGMEELEARIRRLEDIEAIKRLRATYCSRLDAGDWQGAADLFTDDAKIQFTIGQWEGKADIIKACRDRVPQSFSFLHHMCHNPIIEVEGDKATGEWKFELPATHAPTNKALWMAGKWEDEYVKVNGEWKFKKYVSKEYYCTPYDEGWVKTRTYG